MFGRKKSVDQIVQQFHTMAEELDNVINDEVYITKNLTEAKELLDKELQTSKDNKNRASNIKKNILSLVE